MTSFQKFIQECITNYIKKNYENPKIRENKYYLKI